VTAFLLHLIKDQKLQLNMDDEIVRDTLLTHHGEVANGRVREFFGMPAPVAQGQPLSRRTDE
jgi:NAD(P) transhydrogenase subunit alpha